MATIAVDRTGTIPSVLDTDSVYFTVSGPNVTAGLDMSGLLTGLTSVYVGEQWRSLIGSASIPMTADIDADAASVFRYAASGGACWYTPDAAASNVCTLLRNVSRGIMVVTGTGTITTLESGSGVTVLRSGVTATTIRVGGGYVFVDGSSGTAPTTVEITGGTYETRRGVGTSITIWGGKTRIDAAGNTIATMTMAAPDGLVNIVHSGTITTFHFIAGDARNITIARPITITNTVIWASVKNASVFLDEPLITFTNTPTWRIDQGTAN